MSVEKYFICTWTDIRYVITMAYFAVQFGNATITKLYMYKNRKKLLHKNIIC